MDLVCVGLGGVRFLDAFAAPAFVAPVATIVVPELFELEESYVLTDLDLYLVEHRHDPGDSVPTGSAAGFPTAAAVAVAVAKRTPPWRYVRWKLREVTNSPVPKIRLAWVPLFFLSLWCNGRNNVVVF